MKQTKQFVKPKCQLTGQDGNIFMVMGLASRALKKAGWYDKAAEMQDKIRSEAKSYDAALQIVMEYVDAY